MHFKLPQQASTADRMFDLIGDVHGQADELEALLEKLGYSKRQGAYSMPGRVAVFLGDFIDGESQDQLRTVEIARRMVEGGSAKAVMGNHEFNAIAYHSLDVNGDPLRPHTEKNRNQHKFFLDAVGEGSDQHAAIIRWFRTLPLWLEFDGLRVVHACWDEGARAAVGCDGGVLTDDLLNAASTKGTSEHAAIETWLKGREVSLPKGVSFLDGYESVRTEMRLRWWARATSYREAYLGPEKALPDIPDAPLPAGVVQPYPPTAPPLVIGHYWFDGTIEPCAPNVACVDYSVARTGGRLVAYRWDGEAVFDRSKFVSVSRQG